MPDNGTARITIDTVFMSVHVSRCAEVVRLLSMWSNEIDSICRILKVASLRCTAFIGVPQVAQDECLLIQLNTRRCQDSDMTVAKVHPLDSEVFVVTMTNTRGLAVVHVTLFNPQKLMQMQSLAAIDKNENESQKKIKGGI